MPPSQPATRYLTPILLAVILIIAAGLRFYNLNWDGGIFAHPDERSTVAFYAPTMAWPEDSDDLLDPRRSTLNPFWDVSNNSRRSYTYGHFPLYTLVAVAYVLHSLAPLAESLTMPPEVLQFLATAQSGHGYALIGRALVGLADLASVLLLFLIGRRLYGTWGGLLAAAFATFTVLQIQLAHFFAVDPISTTFTLLAIYGAMLMYDRRSVGAALLTGVGIGLAVASKFSALPIVFAPLLAAFMAVRRQSEQSSRSLVSQMLALALLALGVSFLVFAATSPFVLLDFENFRLAVLEEQGNMVSGVADFPFTRQYRDTTAYWYFIDQQLRWGMGWPLGLIALAGTVWVVIKALRGQAQVGELLALAWLVLYFGPTGLFLAKFMRYMSPVAPLLSLFGAGLIVALWRWRPKQSAAANRNWAYGEQAGLETGLGTPAPKAQPAGPDSSRAKMARAAALALAVIGLAGSSVWALAFVNGVYGTEHSWITFSRWIYNNVPDGACIAYEHWDDRMPTNLPEPNGYPAAHQFYQPELPMYNEDTWQKYEQLRDTLLNCDYVALATNRLWRTIPRLPERYPLSSRYYEALFSGELGFELVHSVETPPRLGPLVIDDQAADESFTVYDHPKPMLFKKTRQLSAAEWDALLGGTWQQAVPGYVGPTTLLMRLRGAQAGFFPPQPSGVNEDKPLLLNTPVDQLPALNDYRWNDPANDSALLAIILWWAVILFFGWLAYPLTYLLFNKLPDRGYGLAKSFGLLLLTYFVWLNSSLMGSRWLGNTLATILLGLLIFIAIRTAVAFQNKAGLAAFRREQMWAILTVEVLFTAFYLLFVLLRMLNPDLWHPWLGGEKMLEIGFLNAIVKSVAMPPYDPFFAGGIINYYYYGLFLVNVLIKLTGIAPAIAFNLAVPTLAALTAVNAFSLAGNLAVALSNTPAMTALAAKLRFVMAGSLAVLFIVLMGNLEGTGQLLRTLAQGSPVQFNSAIPGLETLVQASGGLSRVINGDYLATYNYWDPTRVIPETINEFPFFSFLFADLHPHMIGIPFTLLFLSLAFNWLLPADRSKINNNVNGTERPSPQPSPFGLSQLVRWLAIPFVLGALAVINTWDLPTYLGLMLATFLLAGYRQMPGAFSLKPALFLLVKGFTLAGLVLAMTYLLYAPFFLNYHALDVGLGLVHTQTPLAQHLKIWGFFLFVLVSWLWISLLHPASRNPLLRFASLVVRRWNVWPHLSEIYRAVVRQTGDHMQGGLWALGAVLLIAGLLFVAGYRVPAYLLPLVALALLLLFRREVNAATSYMGLLIFTGLLVLLGVEFFFLRDFLGGGDYYRMNTLFKFFIQVWVLFGVAAAVAMPYLWDWSWRWPLAGQLLWRGIVTILLLAGLVYPVLGSRTRLDDRFPGDENRPPFGTLDGLAYMTRGWFEWPAGNRIDLRYDYEAIRWLQNNVEGTPIIAEAKIGYYREGGMRVAAYTGLPSVLGGLHQNEQRYASQIGQRDMLVNEFWSTPDPNRLHELINQLGISYIYVGQIERAVYGEAIDARFEPLRQQGLLELVFENERTRIYKVVRSA